MRSQQLLDHDDDRLPGVELSLEAAVCLDDDEGEYLVDGGAQCTQPIAAEAGIIALPDLR
jgi:hypothetical protein